MGIKYYKLFDMLNRKEMKKSDLRKILSPGTVAKLSKGEYVSGEVIEKLCDFLDCQPGDIMEYTRIMEDSITGKEMEVADHISIWSDGEDPRAPEPDNINVYPTDEDSPYEAGYKKRIF